MILDVFTYFSSKFYKYCSLPFFKLWCVINFFIKYIFFGYENAFLSLSRYDKFNVKLIMKLIGAKIGDKSVIDSGIRFHNCKNLRNLEIGDNCYIGPNVIIQKGTIIGRGSIVGANSFVNKNVPENSKVYGNPIIQS